MFLSQVLKTNNFIEIKKSESLIILTVIFNKQIHYSICKYFYWESTVGYLTYQFISIAVELYPVQVEERIDNLLLHSCS